ncbi:glutathione ABC transporter permease [Compostibacillus humi]|uniref:Glutathione ABC transporter permease n=1 Tax=Compostibacillus humi TaxID=1245525 RepID=A0A8J2TP49_9BACI|nr:ABC transporter permease [Compostibacillus humi]GFZ82146.1 glutathione ABC transporter permease [Compostibacillus humi]
MKKYILRRLLQLIPVLLGIAVISFLLLHMIPGDPATVLLGQEATPEEIERLQENLGLNDPLPVQLFNYLGSIVTFDLGTSIFRGEEVSTIILTALPATIELAVCSLLISLIIAVPLGIIAAVRQNTFLDYFSMFFAQLGISMPVFWLGVLLIMGFSVHLGWFPSFGRGEPLTEGFIHLFTTGSFSVLFASLKHLFLPALSLGVMGSAMITRMIRSTMIEVLDMDYIRTMRAGGTIEFLIVMKYAFRNALLPVITIVGLQFGNLLGGAIVTETIFGWPGLGSLVISSISQRDFPIVQGVVLTIALLFALVNLIVDLLYARINPKIRHN